MAELHASVSRLTLLSGTALIVSILGAHAQNGAQIVYAESAPRAPYSAQAPAPAPQPIQVAERTSSVAPSGDPRTRRIEFRYPDQPDTYYGAGGPRLAGAADAPMAFSSAQSAISAADAQKYAAVTAPESTVRDPAITAGGFDARAAAKAVEAQQRAEESAPLRITAQGPATPTTTGQPLSLSKVSSTQGATLSEQQGLASVYDAVFNGEPTANGEIYDDTALSGAHRTLPLPSLVQVVNETTGREIVIRVNDRGPFEPGRIIDLSKRAADMLGIASGDATEVTLRYLGPAPVLPVQQTAASRNVVAESMQPPSLPVAEPIAYEEPNLGVPDPVDVMTPPPAAQGLGNVFIQVGSFTDIGNAEDLNRSLSRGLPVEIQPARVRGSDYFRVMVGPFNSRVEAERQRDQIASAGIANGFIVVR
ncbi:MAG: septal ring lytic transglycosylase RlpA family protein [Pseudomonadota bacterium]